MIYVDYEWASKKNLDNFQALVLATIVAGFDTYETIIAFWGKKIDQELISDTIDHLLNEDWIELDKRNKDVLMLSATGRFHYADNKKRPTRKAGAKVANQPAVPVLGKVGEMVAYNKRIWVVANSTEVKGKVLFDLKEFNGSDTLSKIEARSCISRNWFEEVRAYFKRCIEDHGYPKYAETWADIKAKEWFKHYLENGWRVGTAKTPMVNWMASVSSVWVTKAVNQQYCVFSQPHASDPQHPQNQRKAAYGSIPGVKEVAARVTAD